MTAFDYIIVGSGAGGGPLAARLAIAGRSVLLIEAGVGMGALLIPVLLPGLVAAGVQLHPGLQPAQDLGDRAAGGGGRPDQLADRVPVAVQQHGDQPADTPELRPPGGGQLVTGALDVARHPRIVGPGVAGNAGAAGRYPAVPSLTWSPASSPADSSAARPVATRSGIMGPSPEGSRTPSSTQV